MISKIESISAASYATQRWSTNITLVEMTVLPTVDQFPTFANTFSWLKENLCKCIWYLPNKKRFCSVQLTGEANKSALHLAESISKASTVTTGVLQVLAHLAEHSCCARHHSNKIWGSGLADELAVRWLDEIKGILSVTDRKNAQTIKQETVSPPISTIPSCSSKFCDHPLKSAPDAQTSISGSSDPKSSLTDHVLLTTHTLPHPKPVAFAKHEVLEGETLVSKLLEPIRQKASTIGSLYIYAHMEDAFLGMVKIGYTSRAIDSRLSVWTECGHGYPLLLDSYNDVRHPERVELLTHFELFDYWYALRWCEPHHQAHIEWFKIDLAAASTTIRLWSLWMERANPYKRSGHLKAFWKDTIEFLTTHKVPITAEVMMQVQEIEEGSTELLDFLDDDVLRKQHKPVAKQEQFDWSQVVVNLPQRTKTCHTTGECLEVKVQPVETKVEELLRPSEMASMTDIVTIHSWNSKA